MSDFLTQQVVVPAWAWLLASGCAVYCVCEIAYFMAKRKWRQKETTEE
jgi:hypothetical protein